MDFITEQKKTPVAKKVDVIVIGGGPAGFGAAMGAARNGAETLLIERYGFLGGMLTAGLVWWLPIEKIADLPEFGSKAIQGGVMRELIDRLMVEGGSPDPAKSYRLVKGFETYFPTDPEIMKVVLQHMIEESGAKLLLHSFAVDVVKEGNEIKGVITESKSGRQAILADRVIDCSGDADIAAAAGAEFEKFEKPLMMTLIGVWGNVKEQEAMKYSQRGDKSREKFTKLVEEAVKNGDLTVPLKQVLPEVTPERIKPPEVIDSSRLPANYYRRREVSNWAESCFGDCTNVEDLTRAEMETRRPLLQITKFLRKYIKGYENAYLAYTGTQVGLRESRRVLGNYYLTYKKNMKEGLKHPESIVKCRYGYGFEYDGLNDLPIFDIPYGCIVPKVVDGLLMAGRCISMDHEAAKLFAPRDESTCMCLGEAAGIAAALSLTHKVQPRNLDISILQNTLKKQGVLT